MLGKSIELVIFDCDGVLVDSEPTACQSLSEYLKACGIVMSPRDVMHRFVGRSLSSCKAILEADGATLPDTFIEDVRTRNLEALSHDLKPIPGIHAALDSLSISVCVASSGLCVKINQSLRLTKLSGYFGCDIFSAQQVSNGKPAPDLFLLATGKMGAKPENTLVIEDNPVGVQAGLAANMQVVGFYGGGHAGRQYGERLSALGAHHILGDMHDLPELINAYRGS